MLLPKNPVKLHVKEYSKRIEEKTTEDEKCPQTFLKLKTIANSREEAEPYGGAGKGRAGGPQKANRFST